MRKIVLLLFTLSLLAGQTFITSCKKKDSTAPVVTLIGGAHINHILNEEYIDPGATALDDGSPIDATIEVNEVEVNLVGDYKVIWAAVDADGNKGTAERTVTVYNEANYLIGNYNIHVKQDSAGVIREFDYTDMVLVAGNVNNQIWVNKFNNYPSTAIYIQIDSTNVNVPNQTVGIPPNQKTFSGYGFVEQSTGNFEVQTMEIAIGPPQYNIQSIVTYIKQ